MPARQCQSIFRSRRYEILDEEYKRARPPAVAAYPAPVPTAERKVTTKERLLWMDVGAAAMTLYRMFRRSPRRP